MHLKLNILIIQIILLGLATPLYAQLQTFDWAGGFSGFGLKYANEVTADSDGNVYILGDFSSTIDLDPGAGELEYTSEGFLDVFIEKLDADGNLIWVNQIGGINKEGASSIVLDSNGDIFVAGFFEASADFISGGASYTLTSEGGKDVFVLKMNSDGLLLWVKQFGSTGNDLCTSMDIDSDGNLNVLGFFTNTVDFDLGPDVSSLTSSSSADMFVLKLNNDGNFIWVNQTGANGQSIRSFSITSDENNNVYTAGNFGGLIDFDPGPDVYNLNTTYAGIIDLFIQKLDSNGSLVWAKHMSGAGWDDINDIAVDFNGNVYTTGRFYDSLDVDPGIGEVHFMSLGSDDMFIQKLDSEGNLSWAKHYGSPSKSEGMSLDTDANGNVYITGYYRDSINFNLNTDSFDFTSIGYIDYFIQMLDSNGNEYWTHSFGGNGSVIGKSITVDAYRNIYVIGEFQYTVDFDPGPDVVNLSASPSGVFIQKLKSCVNVTTDVITSCYPYTWIDGNTYSLSNNTAMHTLANTLGCDSIVSLDFTYVGLPDLTLSLDGFTIVANYVNATEYRWLNCDNNYSVIPSQSYPDFTPTFNGSYAVEFTENGCVDTSACITVNPLYVLESTFKQDITVFPNPIKESFQIELGQIEEELSIYVYTLLGKEIMNLTFKDTSSIPLKITEPDGVYLIRVLNNTGNTAMIKVVKHN